MKYAIKQIRSIDDIDQKLTYFLFDEGEKISDAYEKFSGVSFDFHSMDLLTYANKGLFWICYRGEEPVGILMARLYSSIFDGQTRILMQDILYAIPGASRAAYHLMQTFIAFGRENADHIITTRTMNTNIKAKSLEKLGFREMETQYRLEIKR